MIYHDETTRVIIANVSRRGLLKGVVAAGGLVVAAQIPAHARPLWPMRPAPSNAAWGQDRPAHLRVNRQGRNRHDRRGTARKWGTVRLAPACRWSWRTSSKPTGRGCASCRRQGDEKKYGNQDTDGSRSMRHFIQPMRRCGAAARQMLEQAAAERWGVDPARSRRVNHEVVHRPSGRKLGYGDLADAAAALPTPPVDKIRLKDAERVPLHRQGQCADRRPVRHHDADARSTASIPCSPGMKYAVVARPPVLGGKLISFDAAAALKVPGVEKVVADRPRRPARRSSRRSAVLRSSPATPGRRSRAATR